MAPRRVNHLFRRKGSQNWQLKLQYSGRLAEIVGRKRIEKSLGTPNRAEAEILALPFIQEHKLTLMEAWHRLDWAETQFDRNRDHAHRLTTGTGAWGQVSARILSAVGVVPRP